MTDLIKDAEGAVLQWGLGAIVRNFTDQWVKAGKISSLDQATLINDIESEVGIGAKVVAASKPPDDASVPV